MLCLLSLPPSSASLPARTPRNSLSLGICGLLLEQSVPLQAGIPGQSWQEQFARSAGKADCCHPKAADIPDPRHSVIPSKGRDAKASPNPHLPSRTGHGNIPKSRGSSCLRLVLLESSPSSWNVGPIRGALGMAPPPFIFWLPCSTQEPSASLRWEFSAQMLWETWPQVSHFVPVRTIILRYL